MANGDSNRIAPHPVLEEYYESPEARRERVDDMFDSSAEHYDWITSVMSFGSGRWYRRQALVRAGVSQGDKVLDVGAGTGVVSLLAQEIVGDKGLVVSLDPSKGMLGEAVKSGVKNATLGLGEALPFPDNTFDYLTMGYALRHVADLKSAFEEYQRILKPGGKILLLEITRPEGKFSTAFLKFYLKGIIPNLAKIFRRSADSKVLMRYYWDTIEQCVPPATIVQALKDTGLQDTHRAVVMGIFSEYTGVKPNKA
ncbi:class I SAM-dependent methyltransferase [Marinagarivorans cellulosilyticus]|uniref:Ubiquinone/menaquinone biosynthesis C-methyltransferase UbiE n=1 Tax=Marinagarivorans cellulosilyticus TaxID=2721545 RepID=A0AAN1WFU0_9GAMM|nr:class I SAM-dependent methyltransferase [Marinagarivorans cellulosilyticus]BCD96821.1 demethylmenaquinone methyltransferase / 2-methoxy-6-polyprenyl-1,4-benzoquinol methylase [Marinagarivorans cellulosilyticus]